jgi:outer membrane protein assembly factor BamB
MGHRWSLVMSGSQPAEGAAIAAHGQDVIVAGSFEGELEIGSPTGPSGPALASAGDSDVFVARLDARGGVIWRQRLGGPGPDRASCAAADAGRIVLGLQLTPPARLTEIAPQQIAGSARASASIDAERIDVALVVLHPDGRIAWRHTLPGSRYARISALALTADGGIAVAGTFAGTLRVGDRSLTSAGSTDVFVARFDAQGTPAWALRLGGPGADSAQALTAWSERLVVAGNFDGNVDVGEHLVEAPSAFALSLAGDGAPAWLRLLGPGTMPQALAASPDGALYLAGHFRGSLQLGEHALDAHGQSDAFLGRLDDQGTPRWLLQLGGPGIDHARALAVTSRGVILGGTFEDRLAVGQSELVSAGASDAFAVELDGEAGTLILARRFGGPGHDDLAALAARADVLVMTGSFEGTVEIEGRAITTRAQRSAFALGLDL